MGTKIADIIIPEIYVPYVIQRTMELSALVQSGIMQNTSEFDSLASGGGKTVNMPYFNDLTGDDEILSDSTALTPAKIDTSKDVAVLLLRGKSWSVNELAAQFAGADPMKAIANLTAAYWARMFQKSLLATLKGAFAASNMTGNVHDISGGSGDAAKFTGTTFIDACQLLGDSKDNLSGIIMHSATEAALAKQNLIATIQASTNEPTVKTYMGKRVIVDDSCPVSSTTYTTYIFGPGAVALGNGTNAKITAVETARDALAGEDILVERKAMIIHPRGVKFNSVSVAGATPTNAELETSSNWTRVYENKAVRMVQFKHKIA